MTRPEIQEVLEALRKFHNESDSNEARATTRAYAQAQMLFEIAAQLADVNERLMQHAAPRRFVRVGKHLLPLEGVVRIAPSETDNQTYIQWRGYGGESFSAALPISESEALALLGIEAIECKP